jgi:hypothetical protein
MDLYSAVLVKQIVGSVEVQGDRKVAQPKLKNNKNLKNVSIYLKFLFYI